MNAFQYIHHTVLNIKIIYLKIYTEKIHTEKIHTENIHTEKIWASKKCSNRKNAIGLMQQHIKIIQHLKNKSSENNLRQAYS